VSESAPVRAATALSGWGRCPTTGLLPRRDLPRRVRRDDLLLRHVRTRVKSPQTNGVIGRFFGTVKYEHLYRALIDDGDALAMESLATGTSTPSDPVKPSVSERRGWLTSPGKRSRSL